MTVAIFFFFLLSPPNLQTLPQVLPQRGQETRGAVSSSGCWCLRGIRSSCGRSSIQSGRSMRLTSLSLCLWSLSLSPFLPIFFLPLFLSLLSLFPPLLLLFPPSYPPSLPPSFSLPFPPSFPPSVPPNTINFKKSHILFSPDLLLFPPQSHVEVIFCCPHCSLHPTTDESLLLRTPGSLLCQL